jgi:hypothetical protein
MRRLNLRSTAFHEAGHAVAAILKGIRFSKVWLLRRNDADPVPQNVELGQLTRSKPVNKPDLVGKLDEAKAEAVLAMAGPIAECLAYPDDFGPDWKLNAGDVEQAASCLRFASVAYTVAGDRPIWDPVDHQRKAGDLQRWLQECDQAAGQLVIANRGAIEKVAMELIAKWELTEDEVRNLCK